MGTLRKYSEAIECYNKVIEIDRNFKDVYTRKGFSLDNLGKLNEAYECFKKAIETDSNDKTAYHYEG